MKRIAVILIFTLATGCSGSKESQSASKTPNPPKPVPSPTVFILSEERIERGKELAEQQEKLFREQWERERKWKLELAQRKLEEITNGTLGPHDLTGTWGDSNGQWEDQWEIRYKPHVSIEIKRYTLRGNKPRHLQEQRRFSIGTPDDFQTSTQKYPDGRRIVTRVQKSARWENNTLFLNTHEWISRNYTEDLSTVTQSGSSFRTPVTPREEELNTEERLGISVDGQTLVVVRSPEHLVPYAQENPSCTVFRRRK